MKTNHASRDSSNNAGDCCASGVVSAQNENKIKEICREFGNDRSRLMDMVRAIQSAIGYVPPEYYDLIAREAQTHRVEVQSVVSFYAFLSDRKKGTVIIRLCNDIIDRFKGADAVAAAFERELGISFGQTTDDGHFTLEWTACIGMSDQAPAALANDTVLTNLTPEKVPDIIRALRENPDPQSLVTECGDGNNAHELIRAMVNNNICKRDEVLLGEYNPGAGLKNALSKTPEEVIDEMKRSGLRGRGGAGFLAGLKWEFTRNAPGENKFVLCNADEGEPGTFKDRVLLTERADMMFEGMKIAAYAIGAETGIVYLRAEYAYLRPFLEDTLKKRRDAGLMGISVAGKEGFDFDIRIQMGAGAYVCGEESSLISSCEGTRGDPADRPPFPAIAGYKVSPTAVNNVETYCCAARIMDKGPEWFAAIGTEKSAGTKLLSISGDCERPGIYELPFGVKVSELLEMVGAPDAMAVQIGGPSGQMIDCSRFGRAISFEDLPTGGSIIIFGQDRDLLEVVDAFMEFFVDESCGYCVPCRVGNVLLRTRLQQIRDGKGVIEDLEYLTKLGKCTKRMSRCGLGQTSPNPILSTIENFRPVYNALLRRDQTGFQKSFNILHAIEDASELTGRRSVIFHA
ncbi:MAG: NADH:ubiquinone oxidoreductase [Spartobacteria bacterium]|nr:NADH:ubiquinone oxidoreductase [Spartobacteria bacterium]